MRYVIVQVVLLSMLIASRVAEDGLLLFSPTQSLNDAGKALMLLGLGLASAAYLQMRRSFRVGPEPKPGATLVTSGVYRWLRHPMYTSVILLASGLFLTKPTANMAISVSALVAFFLIKARYEEGKLRVKYPNYGEYISRSFGVLPFWRGR